MSKLDLEWLAVFDEVYKTSSVSRAAENLGMAQATASIALNKLRLHFNDRLFSRTSRGMEPTPYAERLYPELKEIILRLEKARGAPQSFAPRDSQREFRICMTDISEVVLLPALLNHLRQVAPQVRVQGENISTDSPRRLEAGEVDLAVGFMPRLEAGFFQQRLFSQNYVCMVSTAHPRVRSTLTRRAFTSEGHIIVTSAGTGHALVDKMLAEQGVERKVALRLPSFLGLARIVAQTELVALVPALLGEVAASQEAVKLLAPPVELPSYAVKQHWHERYHADPANMWLRRTLAELFVA
ncbi:MAG: LysR family transcriptional regulator [Janthinobacterium lividum]